MKERFSRFANWAANASGHWLAFTLAATLVVLWLVTAPFFHFSNTDQLVINTTTTIITFIQVFLIQHAANVSDAAMHLKLDEIVRAVAPADNQIIDAEDEPEEEIDRQKQAVIRAAKEHQP